MVIQPPSFLKRFMRAWLAHGWERFFHTRLPDQVPAQVQGFLFFGMGVVAARAISAISQIVLGRQLGPSAYGELTLVLLLAGYLVLPMAGGWGMAFVKRVAGATDPKDNLQSLKALLLVSGSVALLLATILILTRDSVAAWLKMPGQHVVLAIVLALASAWWMVAKQIAQAFQRWARYVWIELGWSATVLVLILGLLHASTATVDAIGMAFCIGYALAGLGVYRLMGQSLRTRFNVSAAKGILAHGGLLVSCNLAATAAFGIDRFLIHRVFDAAQVGVYQAHFLSTFGIVGSLMTILITYTFPLFCQDERSRFKQLLPAVCAWQYPLTLIGSAIVGRGVLWLYGYPLHPSLFLCLCAFNAVQVHVQLRAYYWASRGTGATRTTLASQLLFLLVNLALLLTLVTRIGILSGGIALLAAALASLALLIRSEKRLRMHPL